MGSLYPYPPFIPILPLSLLSLYPYPFIPIPLSLWTYPFIHIPLSLSLYTFPFIFAFPLDDLRLHLHHIEFPLVGPIPLPFPFLFAFPLDDLLLPPQVVQFLKILSYTINLKLCISVRVYRTAYFVGDIPPHVL